MLKCYTYLLFWTQLVLLSTLACPGAIAQIIPDNTLGNENSIVDSNVMVQEALADVVSGGAVRENNLFHSFKEFNVGNGARVYFASPDGIANIITRVTGNKITEINGTLGVAGMANLFLLNPNGILFGENASLDINGSVMATTGDSYKFENGFKYSATDPNTPPLLTVNLPVGVQMGTNPGTIQVIDSGHRIPRDITFNRVITQPILNSLKVKNGQTISLIGGEINLNNGTINAPGGRIQLGTPKVGEVDFKILPDNSWLIDYSKVSKFGDITLTGKSLLDVSGVDKNNIQLVGGNIFLKDHSFITSNNFGDKIPENIDIKAQNNIEITGGNEPNTNPSEIRTMTLTNQPGSSVNIESKNLLFNNGSKISTIAIASGKSGDINIKVTDSLNIDGSKSFAYIIPSTIAAVNFSTGDAGNIKIDANTIEILAGSAINSSVLGSGRGGDLLINATESIKVKGIDLDTFLPSTLSSINFNQGQAGDVTINTANLMVEDSGRVESSTLSNGNAGNLTINASESITVTGKNPNSINPSLITSASTIVDPKLRDTFMLPEKPRGDAGNLTINTPKLEVRDNGQVTVKNDGFGDAGTLKVDADSIWINTGGSITASTESGNGGNINLNVQDLTLLRDRAIISAESKQMGNGGNINLNTDAIVIFQDSAIIANAIDGMGGNIKIATQGLFLAPDSKITASSRFGVDGNITLDILSSDRPLELKQLPDNLVDSTDLIVVGCSDDAQNSLAVTGNGGIPDNPYKTQSLDSTWYDLRPVTEAITIKPSAPTAIKEATATVINTQGELELVTIIPLSTYRWVKSICPQVN
ncbi:filamentous hemagglutinin-like protein [Chondrocystis sp. NIES-4102]|nr:filamentous hemagglutinin-like protein [Chondrocystis sp. NIES-4102]